MSLQIIKQLGPQSFVADAYQSMVGNAYFAFGNTVDYAVMARIGTVTGTGRLDWTLAHAAEDVNTVANPDWKELAHGSGIATTSAVETAFRSQSSFSQLPFGRLQAVAKNTGAGSLTISNVVLQVLAELK